jgi:peroxiredoxin
MTTPTLPRPLMPRQPVPALQLPTLDHGRFDLRTDAARHFTLLVFYRGLHCPLCLKYLLELGRLQADFAQRGVKPIAVSSDTPERARAMADKLKAPGLRIGHSLPLSQARDWGLYLSTTRGTTSIGLEEPAVFSEPGLFIVRPDGTLYYGAVQTMPFARPHFDELLAAIDFALAKDYPARGEYAGPV